MVSVVLFEKCVLLIVVSWFCVIVSIVVSRLLWNCIISICVLGLLNWVLYLISLGFCVVSISLV